jgi:hypothetical protein
MAGLDTQVGDIPVIMEMNYVGGFDRDPYFGPTVSRGTLRENPPTFYLFVTQSSEVPRLQ